ncbi:MAG: hypothetical protein M3N05_09925 [Pseudomonadota bacterium]|jgi:hypothetical protein|nr:hypothetical protein [Pseudomonadota bacterium]
MFAAAPLLLLPVLFYNFLALTYGFGATDAGARMAAQVFSLPMASGGRWPVSMGDLIIFLSLVILFIELLKSTTSRRIAIINHSLSMILFIICLVEFLLFRAFATSTFFLLTSMVLLDVLAGFIVTIVAGRRDIDIVS